METRKLTKKLIHIIDSLKDNILLANNAVLYLNNSSGLVIFFVEKDSLFNLFGIIDNKITKKKYFDLENFIHPDDNDLLSYSLLLQKDSNQIAFNIRVIKEDNSVVIFSVKLEKIDFFPISNTLLFKTKLHDVKNLLNVNILEQSSRLNFSSMLLHTYDFIFFKDLHHILTDCSQTLANITGFESSKDMVGLTDYDIFPREHADKYYSLEKEIYKGIKPFIEEIQPFNDENGDEGWVDNRKYPLKDESGKIVGLFGIARIVTQEILTRRELEKTQEQLKILANQDSLTLLSNRRYGYDLCHRVVTEATRYKTSLSLIMFDIDHFKDVNDLHGHDCGDKVLIYIAEVMQKITRETDISFRYGGEEFVICTPHTKLSDAVYIMERINKMLEQSPSSSFNFKVTVSSGIVELLKGESFEELLKRSDELMYQAKAAGRNCIKY